MAWPDVQAARVAVADQVGAATGLTVALDPAALSLPGVLVDVPATVRPGSVDYSTIVCVVPVWLLAPPGSAPAMAWVCEQLVGVLASVAAEQATVGAYLFGDLEVPGYQVAVTVHIALDDDPAPLDIPVEPADQEDPTP